MPALRFEGGNSLNISVTPAVGLSSLCFVHFVEKRQKKGACFYTWQSTLQVDRDSGEYAHDVFIVKAEKYIFLYWAFISGLLHKYCSCLQHITHIATRYLLSICSPIYVNWAFGGKKIFLRPLSSGNAGEK